MIGFIKENYLFIFYLSIDTTNKNIEEVSHIIYIWSKLLRSQNEYLYGISMNLN